MSETAKLVFVTEPGNGSLEYDRWIRWIYDHPGQLFIFMSNQPPKQFWSFEVLELTKTFDPKNGFEVSDHIAETRRLILKECSFNPDEGSASKEHISYSVRDASENTQTVCCF